MFPCVKAPQSLYAPGKSSDQTAAAQADRTSRQQDHVRNTLEKNIVYIGKMGVTEVDINFLMFRCIMRIS